MSWFFIKEKIFLETFLKWVRTSANFYEVPWLSFEPKVSKLPSAWNNIVSSIFLTAESFSTGFNYYRNMELFLFIEKTLDFLCKMKVCLHPKTSSNELVFQFKYSIRQTKLGRQLASSLPFCYDEKIHESISFVDFF